MKKEQQATRKNDGPLPRPARDVLQTPGKPLDPVTRAWAEPHFGRDLSRVRVHADETAAAGANELEARAFTAGSHVAFGAGNYRPDTEAGSRLLAHELTHVGQQASPSARDGASLEPEAHAHSDLPSQKSAMRAPSPLQPAGVQLFEEFEHKSLGDKATGSATYDIGTTVAPFDLSHGDILMLSGDWFTPDDLFRFAQKPGNHGAELESQDEIITAIQQIAHDNHLPDARFAPGGKWHGFVPSTPVQEAVTRRFRDLAAKNDPHYVAPAGRDASGAPLAARFGTAGGTYRTLHVAALKTAYEAGRAKRPITNAMAREAAAQHFLTDAFSAGHLRTPTQSIRDFWNAKYPLFSFNLIQKIALATATEIETQPSFLSGVLSVQVFYEQILESVRGKNLPELSLGDLIAVVQHDVDNQKGLEIVGGGMVFGDEHLDDPNPNNVTRKQAEMAIQLGNQDVREAYTLGGAGGDAFDETALVANVLAATKAPGTAFLAEERMPKPSPTVAQQNWTAPDFETLWTTPVSTAAGSITIGQQIQMELSDTKLPLRKKLDGLADQFPTTNLGIRPRDGFINGFLVPLIGDPRGQILDILNWAPDTGLHSKDQDDVAVQTGEELANQVVNGKSRLTGMTPQARVRYIRTLIGGSLSGLTVFSDEQELVIKIFNTAPVSHRPWLYQVIEGHAWTGKFIEGWTVRDDDLWDALTKPRARRLEAIINGATEP